MRIQHNIMAMNAYRNYNTNNNALSKNLEKLSSGYAINRAGDDAAGLAISEKMRAQITGLDVAQNNAQSGINLVQTAEGAMTEVHDMLNRMYELANQSANGTYDEIDREQLQKELDQLSTEIDRIADSSNFNGIQLLDGSMDAEGIGGGANITVNFSNVNTYVASVSNATPSFTVDLSGLQIVASAASGTVQIKVGSQTLNFEFTGASVGDTIKWEDLAATATGSAALTIGGVVYDVADNGGSLTISMNASHALKASQTLNPAFEVSVGTVAGGDLAAGLINKGTTNITAGVLAAAQKPANISFEVTKDMLQDGGTISIGDQTFTIDYSKTGDDTNGTTTIGVKDLLNDKGEIENEDISEVLSRITASATGNGVFTVGNNGKNMITLQSLDTIDATEAEELGIDTADGLKAQVSVKAPTSTGKALTLQIGDTSDSFNKLSVSIQDMHATSLGIDGIDISTQEGAQAATDLIKNAINIVSDVRGTLGATQNRLEHTINSLSVSEENITSAESSIRDTDVAEEMMAYTKNNILIQSAQAMLAQANQVPQGVLQLLG